MSKQPDIEALPPAEIVARAQQATIVELDEALSQMMLRYNSSALDTIDMETWNKALIARGLPEREVHDE